MLEVVAVICMNMISMLPMCFETTAVMKTRMMAEWRVMMRLLVMMVV